MLFVTQENAHGMQANGIVGLSPEDNTFLDLAYKDKEIASRNFILRLRSYPELSGMYINELPADTVENASYLDITRSRSWVRCFA